MNNVIVAFLLTLIAGLSTLVGAIFIFFKFNLSKLTKYALAFASGVMISVSFTDLLPESLSLILSTNSKNQSFFYLALFIILGVVLSAMIDKLLPENEKIHNKKLYKLGIFSMLAIIMHNIPEGIATFLSSTANLHLGLTLTVAIALHNIPEGISISVPVYGSTKSRKKALGYTFISGMAEPLGAILAFFFLKPFITDFLMGILLAIIAGIMLHIGSLQLLPTAMKYPEKKKTFIFFLIGFCFMIISHFLMK